MAAASFSATYHRLLILSSMMLVCWIFLLIGFKPDHVKQPPSDYVMVRLLERRIESNVQHDLPQPVAIKTEEQQQQGIKFMLVTGESSKECPTKQGSHILMKSYKNKVDYCNLHGCKVWYSLESWHPELRGTWARYPMLKRLMKANPDVEWFMWMDGDAIFTDMSFSIPLQEYNVWRKELIVPGYWDKVFGKDPDWVGLNAGVFLIRNSEWSIKFLEQWMDLGDPKQKEINNMKIGTEIPSRPTGWDADDQSALVYLLRHLPLKDRDKLWLELRYTLHGYWEQIVDLYERYLEGEGKDWPLVTHFCGCKFCGGKYASSSADRCINSFHRAYHFADNQVLAQAGMKHSHLNTSAVQPSNSQEV